MNVTDMSHPLATCLVMRKRCGANQILNGSTVDRAFGQPFGPAERRHPLLSLSGREDIPLCPRASNLNWLFERMDANKPICDTLSNETTEALRRLLVGQDTFLDEHVERVSKLSAKTAEALGVWEHEVRQIRVAAKLHDIGKTAIPAAILDKVGPLDAREWTVMRRHTMIGERIVLAAPGVASVAPIVRASHERVDGRGYPDGLAGEDIPLAARIIAVCDAFDAMTSDRPYREAMSNGAAIEELHASAGAQFDRQVVDIFGRVIACRGGQDG